MKRRWLIILICLNIFLSGISAFAEEGETAAAMLYSIEESFDTVSGMYFERISEDAEFISSVPNGAVVSDGVYFDIPSNLAVLLERDGSRVDFVNKTTVCGQGYYIMKLTAADGNSGVFTFRITAPPQNKAYSRDYKYPKVSCSAAVESDLQTGLYKYTMPNYKAFYTDIAQYGQSVESAKFIIPRNLGYSFKRNGKEIGLINNKVYRESGYYTLRVFSYSYANSGGYEAAYETVLDFTIPEPEREAEFIQSEIPVFSQQDYSYSEPAAQEENTVLDDTLLESYYEAVGIYAESFSTGESFYTNTANGAIVGGNVYIDMPFNMSVEMTKDGVPCQFTSKTYINGEGSYILIITNMSETVVSKASYSFRIQKGVESSKLLHQNTAADNGSAEQTEKAQESEQAEYELADNYDEERGMYVSDCGGVSFYCSVPDGMFTSQSVMLDIPDSLNAQLYKDGEQTDFAYNISDDGRYTLKVSSDTAQAEISFDIAAYTVNYLDEFTAPEGYFIIEADYTDFMAVYSDSTDELASEYENGLITIEDEKLNADKVFALPLDGQYNFILQGAMGMPMLSVELLVDRKAPQVSFDSLDDKMKTESESVTISCSDPEAVLTLTDGNGESEEINLVNGSAEITGSGSYTLTVFDGAGNVNEYQFTLGAKSSGGTVILIMILPLVFVIAVIAAIIFIVKMLFLGGSKE